MLEVLHYVEKGREVIEFSAQVIFDNFLLDGKLNKDGRVILDTINWVNKNGCVQEQSYTYVGSLNMTKTERKVH